MTALLSATADTARISARKRLSRRQNAFPRNFSGMLFLKKEKNIYVNEVTNINIPLKKKRDFDPAAFLAQAGLGRAILHLVTKERAFSQGDTADSIFYIQSGRVRLSVIAKTGK